MYPFLVASGMSIRSNAFCIGCRGRFQSQPRNEFHADEGDSSGRCSLTVRSENTRALCRTRVQSEQTGRGRMIKCSFSFQPVEMDTSSQALFVAAALGLPLLVLMAFGLALAFQPIWAVRWLQRHLPNVIFLKPTKDKVIALTIDDAPHRDVTPKLLRILKEFECRATWFIIGSNMDSCPDLVAQMHTEGHEVGNHTMYDSASWELPVEEFEKQLLAVDDKLKDYYFKDGDGRPIKWFRPGHGFLTHKILRICESHGYRTALGSLFPLDTLFTNQGKNIVKYLLWRIHCGAVLVLHDRGPQKTQTAEVLRILLPELKKQGFSIVTLSELFNLKAAAGDTTSAGSTGSAKLVA